MFACKIEGTNQDKLLRHLRALHSGGYISLLRCLSIAQYMSPITFRPTLVLSSEPSNIFIAMNIILEWWNKLFGGILIRGNDTHNIRCILLHQSATTASNIHQNFLIKSWLGKTLIPICMSESDISHNRGLTARLKVIQRFAVDSVTHILYKALLCYKAGNCNQALKLVQLSKKKISAPFPIYFGYGRSLIETQYRHAGGENLPFETMLRRHFIIDLMIENDQYIQELYIEGHGSSTQFDFGPFFIPPILCAFFLQYLCHRRLGCQREADDALYELSLYVKHDDGQQIHDLFCGLSWQILGICQQMNGDDWAACHSYLTALRQNRLRETAVASCIRLGTILVKYYWLLIMI